MIRQCSKMSNCKWDSQSINRCLTNSMDSSCSCNNHRMNRNSSRTKTASICKWWHSNSFNYNRTSNRNSSTMTTLIFHLHQFLRLKTAWWKNKATGEEEPLQWQINWVWLGVEEAMDQIWIQRTKNSVIVAVHAVKVIWGGLVHISNVASSI
jgi:hypothetical protein